jgi:hypothetical protein
MVASVEESQAAMRPKAVRGWQRDSLLMSHPVLNDFKVNEEFEEVMKENRKSLRRSSSF